MTVYVIIGIWSGSIEEVSAWTDSVKANTEVDRLKKKWDIIPGHEAESEHVLYLYELEVQ